MIARLFFCAAPALIVGLLMCVIHPIVGCLIGMCMFGLGLDVTRARPERGEKQ